MNHPNARLVTNVSQIEKGCSPMGLGPGFSVDSGYSENRNLFLKLFLFLSPLRR